MGNIYLSAVLAFALAMTGAVAATAQTVGSDEMLNQYISDLQKNPDDTVLRERIITYVRSMNKPPAIPEEARRYFIEGNALLKAAKEQKGYELALASYRQCLLIAPWWPEANYNFAIALELANRFDSAMNALKLYIAAGPGEEESRKAQDKIYEIGAKKKLAAIESGSESTVAKKQNEPEEWLKKINGRRYVHTGYPAMEGTESVLDVKDKTLIQGTMVYPNSPIVGPRGYSEFRRYEIVGREASHTEYIRDAGVNLKIVFVISDDGEKITEHSYWGNNPPREEAVFFWKR